MYSNTIKSYCLNCHDNTSWTQRSIEVVIDNYENRGSKVRKALYVCDKCGNTNTFALYVYD